MRGTTTMTRTQIYLSEAQQQALNKLAQQRQLPKSELIRLALEQWLVEKQKPAMSRLEMLRKIEGMWKDREDMVDSVAYVNDLRRQGAGQRQAMLAQAWF
jgi:predicted transcriptional regulator